MPESWLSARMSRVQRSSGVVCGGGVRRERDETSNLMFDAVPSTFHLSFQCQCTCMLQYACVVYALFTLTDTRNRAFATRGCMPSPLANVCEGILESPLSQYDAARWREEGDRAAGRCSARREGRGGGIGRRAAARHGALSSLSLSTAACRTPRYHPRSHRRDLSHQIRGVSYSEAPETPFASIAS